MQRKTWNGQTITLSKNGEDFLPCAKCKELVGMRSTAWIDTKDNKQKHYGCLSEFRLNQIKKENQNETI